MAVHEKPLTAEDVQALSQQPEYQGMRLDVIDGEVFALAPAGWIHGNLAMALGAHLFRFAREHSLGQVTAAETGYMLAPGTLLGPDVGFIAASRIPAQPPEGYVPFAPDLAVEIISPGNTASEMGRKIEKYIRHGTRLVWVVDPEAQRVDVYRPAEGQSARVEFIDIDGMLDGGDVLPGFSLPLKDLFDWK